MRDRSAWVSGSEFQRSRVKSLSGLDALAPDLWHSGPFMKIRARTGSSGILIQVADGGTPCLWFSQFKGMLEKFDQELPDFGHDIFLKLQVQPSQGKTRHDQGLNWGKRCLLISRLVVSVWTWQVLDTVIWLTLVESCGSNISRAIGWDRKKRLRFIACDQGNHWRKIQELQEQKKHLCHKYWRNRVSRGSLTLSRNREILGLLEASTWKSRQYAIMKCWKEIKMKQERFPLVSDDEVMLTEMPARELCTMSLIWSVISRVSIEIKLFRMGPIAEETPVKLTEKQKSRN